MARLKHFARRVMLRLTAEMDDAIRSRLTCGETTQDFIRSAIEREIERRGM